jgi:hypothetical protein
MENFDFADLRLDVAFRYGPSSSAEIELIPYQTLLC